MTHRSLSLLLLVGVACSDRGNVEPGSPAALGGAAGTFGAAGGSGKASDAGASTGGGGAGGAGAPSQAGAQTLGGAGAGTGPVEPTDDPATFLGRGPGKIFDATILPMGTEKFAKANYRIYVPDGVTTLRGIVIHQHGCGRNGIDMAHDLHWQVLANKWAFALLGTFYEDGGNCGNWANLGSGSVQALERALTQLAGAAGKPELSRVPWALWGHSGGGNWAYAVGRMYPERVIAVVPRSGAGGELPAAALGVPQLLSAGQHEEGHEQFGNAYVQTVAAFERERPRAGLVGLSLDPEATHDIREGRFLAIPYLDASIRLRLPAAEGDPLEQVPETSGWLGDVKTFEVAAFGSYGGDKTVAAWLPSQAVARAWAEFERSGHVTDTTPPPAPRDLQATREGGSVRLNWRADADLEGGIKRFVIYRDGVKLAEVGNPFQQGNFGDEPEPVQPEMAFVDAAGPISAAYEVATVNFSDLESPRSAKASP